MPAHSNQEHLSLPVAVIVGAVIVGGSIIFAASRTPAQTTQAIVQAPPAAVPAQPPAAAKAADIRAVKIVGAKIVGNASAPVTVAYWYDYNCGFCKGSEEQIISPIMDEYVRTGKIRLVFKDLQFLKADSTKLGIASRAVWEAAPSKYYDWHKLVFENQGQLDLATNEKLLALTVQALGKADADKAMSLMTAKAAAYQALIDADKTEGASFGVRSTPSFIIGNQLIVGLKSYSDIKAAIEMSLKK